MVHVVVVELVHVLVILQVVVILSPTDLCRSMEEKIRTKSLLYKLYQIYS